MLTVLLTAMATLFVELPRYENETFRLKAHYAFGARKRALIVRDRGGFVKLDYVDAGVTDTRITTHDLSDCPQVERMLSAEFAPPAFVEESRMSDGTVVIVPDGPLFRATAKEGYTKLLTGTNGEGSLRTRFGRWAQATISAAEVCEAR